MVLGVTLPWQRDSEGALSALPEDDNDDLYAGSDEIATTPPAEESALITAARAGDEEAFAALVTAHQAAVLRLAYRMVRDEDEAADITQDVFLAAWRGLANFRGDSLLATWLYRITYHRCLRSIESRRQQVSGIAQFAAAQRERFVSAWSTMQSALAEQQWRQSVQDLVSSLPEKYSVVLALRHQQDLSYEEIANHLAIPISRVKTHLYRARVMFAERIEQLSSGATSRRDEISQTLQDLAAGVEGGITELLRGHVALAAK